MTKAEIFETLTKKAADTYRRKNADYGDSFTKTREAIPHAILVRLHDKLNRLTTLMLNGGVQKVKDENIDDTLLDLANYALMELTERQYDRYKENIDDDGVCVYKTGVRCSAQPGLPDCSPESPYCPVCGGNK